MTETFTHNCVKPGCGNKYESNDQDAYYCPTCVVEKERIAKEVDAKITIRPRKQIKTGLQEYDEARGNAPFPTINSLGIKL